MRKALRWLGYGLAGLLALILVGAVVIFAISEVTLRKNYQAAAETLAAPSPAQLADAPRQARILGCVNCHGEGLKGKTMIDSAIFARVVAPNLTDVAARATDQQLAAGIRQGIGHDGRALFIMPSAMYSRLSDGEVSALIRFIRGQPRAPGEARRASFGPIGRTLVATGGIEFAPATVKRYRAVVPIDLGPAHAEGRRIASNVCSECHGPALFGQKMPEGSVPPDLNTVAGYDLGQFKTLMRTGRTPGGNELGLMKEASLNDLKHLTDAEIEVLHAYLVARAKKLGT
jgi:mono/diheme cytochrome c family protein